MSRILTLLSYKIRFFFGPSLRGRFGPLAYLGLVLLFGVYGFSLGSFVAGGLEGGSPGHGIDVLSAPLSALLALGLLYGVFSGVTAHVSEFDFFMTADLRSREFLVSDLLFEFVSLFGAGGLAVVIAAFGMVLTLGRPLWTVAPLVAVLLAFALLILMVIQLIAVLAVRYPKGHVRAIGLVILALSLLPAISLAVPSFPVHFEGLPIPTTAFGTLGYDILLARPLDLVSLAVAGATFLLVVGLWVSVSDTYIFHGIHPSLSAGFGQVDMAARMAQQQRITARFGKLTTGVTVRTERGSDTGFMTRYHLLRIVRDGSIVFIALFGLISLLPIQVSSASPGTQSTPTALITTQILSLLIAILALNWSYYERQNLWVVVVAAQSTAAYFRGLMMSFVVVGLAIVLVFMAISSGLGSSLATLSQAAIPVAAAFASGIVAVALLTRLKVQPSAFSLGMFLILVLVVVAGYLAGFGALGVLLAAELGLGLGVIVQAILLVAYCLGLAAFGLWFIGRLAPGFRL
jgi:hypothetical protein